MYQYSTSEPKRARSAVVSRSGRQWSASALSHLSRVPLALGAELTQRLLVTMLRHRQVLARRTQSAVTLVERLVAAFQQVQLRIAQRRIAVGVIGTIALPQETRSTTQPNQSRCLANCTQLI